MHVLEAHLYIFKTNGKGLKINDRHLLVLSYISLSNIKNEEVLQSLMAIPTSLSSFFAATTKQCCCRRVVMP